MTSTDNAIGTVGSAAGSPASGRAVKKDGFVSRLSTGTGAFDVLRPRRTYYLIGLVLVVASIMLIVLRGFNLGIDFAGGTKLTFAPGQNLSSEQISKVVQDATGIGEASPQKVGNSLQITLSLDSENPQDKAKVAAAAAALTNAFHPVGGVITSAVSGTWGQEVSQQAIISVIVFLIAVGLFIWIRYERRAAVAAVASTIQVLVITAGIYSLVGFEMSPATVIGLLTILGFSLYDTVVVFDKVSENTRGLTSLTRRTYGEAANLAINQTLMRSINTSLIALLPVAGLLIAGIALLGSGTLKDLALVQLVGMVVGVYSSLFVAVPLAVDLRLREPAFRAHTKRVLAKRAADGLLVDAVGDPIGVTDPVVRRARSAKPGTPYGRSTKAQPQPVAAQPVLTTLKKPASSPVTQTTAQVRRAGTPGDPLRKVGDPVVKPGDPVVKPGDPVLKPGDSVLKPGAAPRPGMRPAGARSKPRPSGKSARPTGKRGR